MSGLVRVEAPSPLLTAEQLRPHLNLTDDLDDAMLDTLIALATNRVEQLLHRSLGEQSHKLYFDYDFPYQIYLLRPPILEVTAIKYIDTEGEEQTVDESIYEVDLIGVPPSIVPAYGCEWPDDVKQKRNAVWVEYTAGYEEIPPEILQAIKIIATGFYLVREPSTDKPLNELPGCQTVGWLLAAHTVDGSIIRGLQ